MYVSTKPIFAAVLAISLLLSCGKPNEEPTELESREMQYADKKSVNKDETRVVNFTDAPTRLARWFNFQKKTNPTLTVASFRPTDTIEGNRYERLEHRALSDFDSYLIYSPDKTRAIDLYSYERTLSKRADGRVELLAGSPSSRVLLRSAENNETRGLLFCGTPCSYEDAYWLNNQELVVSGAMEDKEGEKRLTLWHINLENGRIIVFQNPLMKLGHKSGLYADIFLNEKE